MKVYYLLFFIRFNSRRSIFYIRRITSWWQSGNRRFYIRRCFRLSKVCDIWSQPFSFGVREEKFDFNFTFAFHVLVDCFADFDSGFQVELRTKWIESKILIQRFLHFLAKSHLEKKRNNNTINFLNFLKNCTWIGSFGLVMSNMVITN